VEIYSEKLRTNVQREELRSLHVELESEEEEEGAAAGGLVVAGGLRFHKSDQAVVSQSSQAGGTRRLQKVSRIFCTEPVF
jgi:hypothetical protein